MIYSDSELKTVILDILTQRKKLKESEQALREWIKDHPEQALSMRLLKMDIGTNSLDMVRW